MNYAARNLSNKLRWMTRQLRWINQVAEIQDWVAAMQSLNKLILAVTDNSELVEKNEFGKVSPMRYYTRNSQARLRFVRQEKEGKRKVASGEESQQPAKLRRRVVRGKRTTFLNQKAIDKTQGENMKTTTETTKYMDVEQPERVDPREEVD